MGGPPASRMINMVAIGVLEQWWLAQLGLAPAGAPHDDGGEAGERPDCGETYSDPPGTILLLAAS